MNRIASVSPRLCSQPLRNTGLVRPRSLPVRPSALPHIPTRTLHRFSITKLSKLVAPIFLQVPPCDKIELPKIKKIPTDCPEIDVLHSHAENDDVENMIKISYPDVDLLNLGGYEEIIDMFAADYVRYLQDPIGYSLKNRGIIPKGVVLSGEPGTGKTLIGAAIAGHAGVPLVYISAAEIDNNKADAEKRLRKAFESAGKKAPCVLCIDEIDSIASKRIPINEISPEKQPNARWGNNITNQLLTLLSQDNKGVVIVGATNFPDDLDPAVIRPGRFDKHIRLTLPTFQDRKRILEKLTKDVNLSPNVSLEDLVKMSQGFSGAKLAGWVKEAVLCANKQKSNVIEPRHFDIALTIIEFGIERPNNENEEEKLLTATHESGHAIVGHLLLTDKKMFKVTINPTGNSGGRTMFLSSVTAKKKNQQDLLDEICTALAGRAAEKLINTTFVGSSQDFHIAKSIANKMVGEEGMGSTILGSHLDIEVILEEQMKRAVAILEENKTIFDYVRHTLAKHHVLYREDFLKALKGIPITKPTQIQEATKEEKVPLPPSRRGLKKP